MNINAIIELRDAVGTKAKQGIIKKYADDVQFKSFLYYALNPRLTYNLSEKALAFRREDDYSQPSAMFENIFQCCEELSRYRGLDNATARQVRLFLYHCSDTEREIYRKLLAKTLRLGVTAKTVNKIFPMLLPEWEVQQAFPIEKYPVQSGTEFWLSEKLNGVRATFYNNQLIARSGVPYIGLDHIIKEIQFVYVAGFVLDGELVLKDKGDLTDNEAFRQVTGIINSESENKTTVCFRVFDIIPIGEFESSKPVFESSKPVTRYSIRRDMLTELEKMLGKYNAKFVEVLPSLYHGNDLEQIPIFLDKMVKADKEGLMLNKDVPYRRKRHKGILKIKRFYTMDLPIIRCEEGTGRLSGTLGALVLSYKGNEVKVGSGFSDEQRAEFWKRRDELIETICEVKYKEVSYDKKSKLESLQFPVFVSLRTDKTEVSYA